MMGKEHFIETFGVPFYTMSTGGSGGAYTSLQLADAFPGLFDGEHGFRVLRCQSPAIPNAIAALLLHIRNRTGNIPHVYFGWTEGNPITYLLKFLAFGEGDTAPVTREVLRKAIKNPLERPRIHVG